MVFLRSRADNGHQSVQKSGSHTRRRSIDGKSYGGKVSARYRQNTPDNIDGEGKQLDSADPFLKKQS